MTKKKFILDPTCGYKMMWFNKNHPNALYLDERKECNPDIVGDFRDLSQFADNSFKLIIWDPQNRINHKNEGISKTFLKSYGYLLNPETWQSDLKRGFDELWRILEPAGILIFKWSTHDIKAKKILSIFPVTPLFGQITTGHKKKKYSSQTFWFCFMKILEDKKE